MQRRLKAPRKDEQLDRQKIIKTRDNDTAITNAAMELEDDESSVINKPTIYQRAQVGKALSTPNHQRNNSITCDGNHVQFKRNPYIAM